MTLDAHLIFLTGLFALAAITDTIWLDLIRPHLAPRYGWRAIRKDERIPKKAWLGALVFTLMLIWIGPAVLSTFVGQS